MIAAVVESRLELRLDPVAPPVPPLPLEPFRIALAAQVPPRVKFHWDHGGIMGPVLEKSAITFIKALQVLKSYRRKISLKDGALVPVGLSTNLVKSHIKFIEENPEMFDISIDNALAELRPLLAA